MSLPSIGGRNCKINARARKLKNVVKWAVYWQHKKQQQDGEEAEEAAAGAIGGAGTAEGIDEPCPLPMAQAAAAVAAYHR